MADLGVFYKGISKIFNVTITYNGSNPDISSDTVTFYLHDEDDTEVLSEEADVATSGASGIAIFNLTPTELDLDSDSYICTILWETGDDKHILHKGRVDMLPNVV